MGAPGCPELASCTASMASVRTVAMQVSGGAGVVTGVSGWLAGGSLRCPGAGLGATAPRSVTSVVRRTVSAGALALAALFAAGCGPGQDSARVATSPPAEFVDAVRQLVRPAERMGVVSASAADATGAQPSMIEVDGLVGDAERELRDFRAMQFGDPALRAEQARLVSAMRSIVARMKAVQATLRSGGRAGLPGATTSLLGALEGLPSAAR